MNMIVINRAGEGLSDRYIARLNDVFNKPRTQVIDCDHNAPYDLEWAWERVTPEVEAVLLVVKPDDMLKYYIGTFYGLPQFANLSLRLVHVI